ASAWGGYGAGLMQRNDIEGAVKAFRIAIFLDESGAGFWSDLAQAHMRRNDHKEAFRCLNKAKEHGNLSFDVYLQCGVCAAELHDEVTALENWGLAVKSNPDHPTVPQVLSL